MTDKLDSDIKRALQSGPRDLAFTPEMRRSVLERLQAEESAPNAPVVRAGRSPRSLAVPRPVLWTAVAAAALFLAFRLDLGGAGGRHTAMDSASPAATTAAPQAEAQAPTDQGASGAAAQAQAAAPAPATTPPQANSTDAYGPSVAAQAVPFDAQKKEQPQPVILHLAAAAADATPNVRAKQTAAPQPPVEPRGFASAMARPTIRLALQPAGDHVIELNTTGLRAVLPDGTERWSTPIPELTLNARLLPIPDGRLAVLSGNTVSIVSAAGGLDQSITLSDPVTDVAFGPDGRIALAGVTQVDVRKGDASQFQVATDSPAYVAFAPDGTLATLFTRENHSHLTLRDASGQHPVDVTVPDEAHVLTVSANLVLAGSQAYDLKGAPLWKLPFNPQGVSRLGSLLVAWDEKEADCVDANGAILWRTAFDGEGLSLSKVVPAPDGHSLVIIGAAKTGGMVWVAGSHGDLLSSQATAVVPVDAAFTGDELAILSQDSLSFTK